MEVMITNDKTFQPFQSACSRSSLLRRHGDAHLAGVVQNAEHQFVFVLFGFGELHMTRVGVQQLVHEGNVSGFGEPALLIQQGQDARRVVLTTTNQCVSPAGYTDKN